MTFSHVTSSLTKFRDVSQRWQNDVSYLYILRAAAMSSQMISK